MLDLLPGMTIADHRVIWCPRMHRRCPASGASTPGCEGPGQKRIILDIHHLFIWPQTVSVAALCPQASPLHHGREPERELLPSGHREHKHLKLHTKQILYLSCALHQRLSTFTHCQFTADCKLCVFSTLHLSYLCNLFIFSPSVDYVLWINVHKSIMSEMFFSSIKEQTHGDSSRLKRWMEEAFCFQRWTEGKCAKKSVWGQTIFVVTDKHCWNVPLFQGSQMGLPRKKPRWCQLTDSFWRMNREPLMHFFLDTQHKYLSPNRAVVQSPTACALI